jgi:hypothetical protein
VLWCYANAEKLVRGGVWVVCADEMPNCQVLERFPIRRGEPDSIERQKFDYPRHGTVHIHNFMVVHIGKMESLCLEAKDSDHFVAALRHFRSRHHG